MQAQAQSAMPQGVPHLQQLQRLQHQQQHQVLRLQQLSQPPGAFPPASLAQLQQMQQMQLHQAQMMHQMQTPCPPPVADQFGVHQLAHPFLIPEPLQGQSQPSLELQQMQQLQQLQQQQQQQSLTIEKSSPPSSPAVAQNSQQPLPSPEALPGQLHPSQQTPPVKPPLQPVHTPLRSSSSCDPSQGQAFFSPPALQPFSRKSAVPAPDAAHGASNGTATSGGVFGRTMIFGGQFGTGCGSDCGTILVHIGTDQVLVMIGIVLWIRCESRMI